ncbi:hypothetical protein H8E88_00080 [candidate division KSB1 bacterium]|nr:hypothetical protein [candidate division KSB1 bacterium]
MNDLKKKLPQFKDFRESFIAFIDILGFNNKVKAIKTKEDFDEISKLMLAIKETANRFNLENDDLYGSFSMIAVSDSLIISVPYTDDTACFKFIEFVRYIQYTLLVTSFRTILRGYLNKGPVYNKDGILFGLGYSVAYEKEQKIGGAPRIVVSPEIIRLAEHAIKRDKTNRISIFERLRKDKDGSFYIDYLLPYGDAIDTKYPKSCQLEELQSVPRFIDYNIKKYQDNPKVLKKYIWLKEYFESTKDRLEQLV